MTLIKDLPTAVWQRYLDDSHPLAHLPLAIGGALLLLVAYSYSLILYRIHLHPLSKFPGPREAARSGSWLYRQIKSEFPEATFEKLHQHHQAKAIRIGPNELHISDTTLYKAIYKQSNPFPKHEQFYLGFNSTSPTSFTEVDHDKHRERRRMLNPMFSRAGVLKLEDLVYEQLKLLENKINRLREKQDINLYAAFRLLTTSIILEFCFADSGAVMDEDPNGFDARFIQAFINAAEGISTLQHYPWLRTLVNSLPEGLVKALNPKMGCILEMADFSRTCVKRWRRTCESDRPVQHPIVLDQLKSLNDAALVSESLNLLVAGSDTSAVSLTVAVLEILSNPGIEKRLVEELDAAIPDKDSLPPLQSLEKIEYLTACVKEGIRFASAVPGRLPRVVPKDDSNPLIVDDKIVPPGTIVSITAHTMHTSTDLWGPDARIFNPDRWLAPEAKSLEQYQVAFSRGSRMCLGQNLVPLEMTIILASIFKKYKLGFPPGFVPPHKVDNFTLELEGGLPLKVSQRA